MARFQFAFCYRRREFFNAIEVIRISSHVIFDLIVLERCRHIIRKRPTHFDLGEQSLLVHLINGIKVTEIVIQSSFAELASVLFENLRFAVDGIDLDGIDDLGIRVTKKRGCSTKCYSAKTRCAGLR